MSRVCSRCDATISQHNKSGLCKSCCTKARHADPAWAAKHRAAVAAAASTPEYRARRSAAGTKLYQDPAARQKMSEARKAFFRDNPERRIEQGKAAAAILARWRAENPDFDWVAWHADRVRRQHPWCPPSYWDEYQELRIHLGAAEAKALILAQIAEAERKRRAAMSPFERMQDAVARGATLITKPVLRKADHAFTLAGNSMGSLA